MPGTVPESVYAHLKAFLWQKRLHECLLVYLFSSEHLAVGFIHLDKHIIWLSLLRGGNTRDIGRETQRE